MHKIFTPIISFMLLTFLLVGCGKQGEIYPKNKDRFPRTYPKGAY